jgi:uncharacterized repeat protein (TIGR01451 family)
MGGWALRGRHVTGVFVTVAAAGVVAMLLQGSASTVSARTVPAVTKAPTIPVSFQPNLGQVSARGVKFLAQTTGASVYLTPRGAVITAAGIEGGTAVVGMKLVGASSSVALHGTKRVPGVTNYLIGRDPKNWHTGIHSFAGVRYRNAYPGVDLLWHGANGKLEYDYVVAPGADPSRIRLGLVGAKSVTVNSKGNLAIRVGSSTLNQQAPVIYQTVDGKRRLVSGRFELGTNATIGFRIGSYDHSLPLTIDPLLYSSYLGGSLTDIGLSIAVDSANNTYVAGQVSSTNFPTVNPFQAACDACTSSVPDAFVSKLNPSGTALIYSTYLGGSGSAGSLNGTEAGRGIAVDSAGDAFVVGGTNSTDFPTTPGAYISSESAVNPYAFVTKLNPAGNGLVYSTYLGATGNAAGSGAFGVALDSAGEAYVTGNTLNTNFPTVSPFQANRGTSGTNATDAFVAKFNASGSGLVFSSFLGGGLTDQGQGIAVDSAGNAYVTGLTNSTDFPTSSPFQSSLGGTQDAFLTEVSPSGALISSSYFGGSGSESGNAIAVDASGNVYLTGSTGSTNLPTKNPFQPANGGGTDAFIAKFNPGLTTLAYSSYLGGTATDAGNGIAVDSAGNAYVGGNAGNSSFPTLQSLQSFGGGSADGFVTEVGPSGSRVYSTFLGGNATDNIDALAVDSSGNALVTGAESSTNFPVVNPIESSNHSSTDAFVSDISISAPAIATQASSSVMAGGSISDSATLTGGSSPTGTITFNVYGPGDTTCATPLATSTATVTGDATYPSAPFVTSTAGTYQWTASYGGDSNNAAASEAAPCGDISEAVVVTPTPGSSAVVSASTAMTGTTGFTAYKATATCPSGSTLTSGGETLTRGSSFVGNDGAVILGLFPADGSGNNSVDGATTPASLNAYGGYSGMAPGLDTTTGYAICVSNVTAATVVKVMATAAGSLGPVTAVCPTGSSLVGGGGGLSGFVSGTNAKLYDSYPSDAAGDLPSNGDTNPTAWTVKNNSNSATNIVTTAVAVCATDVTVPTTIVAATTHDDPGNGGVTGGSPGSAIVTATVSCGAGTVLLAGGSHVVSSQGGAVGGPGNGGQGVHLIGDYPSDSSGNILASGSPGSWTAKAQNGGQAIDTLDTTAYALCAQASTTATADLSVTNSGSPNPVSANSTLTYTLTAANAGPAPATDATVTDTLPSGTAFVSASSTSGNCLQSAGVVTCHLGTLANGGTATMTVKVVPFNTGSISAVASITAVESDPSTANNSATATNTVGSPSTDLSISNTDNPDPDVAGSTLTYTIVVTNNGPDTSTGGTVTDTVPSTATFVSATGTTGNCSQTNGVVTCFTGTLANGATSTITLKVTPSAAGPLSDTASVSGIESDPSSANNSATANTTITKASPTLATQASAATTVGQPLTDVATLAGGSGPPGGMITYNLYAPSDTGCNSSVFTTTKPATGNGSYTSASFTANQLGTYRWVVSYGGDANNSGTVPGTCGDSTETTAVSKASPTLTTQVDEEVATLGNPITDTATLAGSGGPATGSITISVYGPSDSSCSSPLAMSNLPVSGNGTYTSSPFTPATTGTYRWIASYPGDSLNNAPPASSCTDTNEFTVVRAAGAGLTGLVDATTAFTNGVSFTATTVTGGCPGGTVLVGGGGREYHGAFPGDQNETAGIHINGSYPSDGSGNAVANNTNDARFWSLISAYGGQSESGDSQTVYSMCMAGGAITSPSGPKTVVEVVSAAGSSASAHQAVTATCPQGSTLVGGGGQSQPATSGNLKPIGSFPSDASGNPFTEGMTNPSSWTVVAGIMGNLGGSTTTVYAVCSLETSLQTVVHTAQVHYVPQSSIQGPGADYPATASCAPGQELLDGGTQFLVGGTYPPSGNGYYGWHLTGDYPSDASGNPPTDGTVVPNSWTGQAHGGGILITSIDVYGYALCAKLQTDLSITDNDSPDPVTVGNNVTHTLTITNNGIDDATGVSVLDTLPAGTNLVSATPSQGGCTPSAGTVTCSLGGIGNGGSATISVLLTTTAAGTIQNSATVSGNETDPSTANNTANEMTTVSKASPTLGTQASAGVQVGGSVSDGASLTGGYTPSGTVTFTLYGPDDPSCTTLAGTSTVPLSGTSATSDSVQVLTAGTYRWIATYNGDSNNQKASNGCTDSQESVVVSKAPPTMSTTASEGVAIGNPISDSASLTGGFSPSGTVTFKLYGPDDSNCDGAIVTTLSGPVSDGSASSGTFTPTAVGTYRWTASYGGDQNNDIASAGCNAPGESVVVSKASPSLSTTASPGIAIGGSISDTATLTNGYSPSGTVTFKLYGPDDSNCNGSVVTTLSGSVNNGSASSGTFTPTAVGTYRWTASYGGDPNNETAVPGCNADGESVVVAKASPSLSTTASSGVPIGGSISDSATLTSGDSPSGTVTFTLFGPDDSNCGGAVVTTLTGTVDNGSASSGTFTPATAGTYRWTASYGGDPNNAVASAGCNADGESVVVAKATPTISTTASPGVPIGGSISDMATLSGGDTPSGTVTFSLYGPDDSNCTGAVVTTLPGTVVFGSASSGSFTPATAGTYRWIASYGGDPNNAAISGGCNDSNESVQIAKASPTISTTASPGVSIGGSISDTATLAGGDSPSGTVTFKLYGPDDGNCSGPVVTTLQGTVAAGSASSSSFTPTTAGAYRWIASYGGDPNNQGIAGRCSDSNESVQVAQATPTLSTTASPNVSLGGTISDHAALSGGFAPTGTVTFQLYGPNNSSCSGSPVTTLTGTVSGGSASSGTFKPNAAGTYQWVASYGGDANNQAAPGGCNASGESVLVAAAAADIQITKVDSPDPVGVGGVLTYTIVVKNNGTGSASGVVMSDPLPTSLSLLSATSTLGSCSGNVSCTIDTLAKNQSATITIKATATTAGTVTNTATVSANEPDPKPSNNTATAVTTVKAPDVSIRKSVSVTQAGAASTLAYKLVVSNGGPGVAHNVTLTDPLPAGSTLMTDGTTQGLCMYDSGSNTVTCALGDFASRATATVTISIIAGRTGSISNTATVSADEGDSNPANNSATATATVRPPSLTFKKTVGRNPSASTGFTYTLTVADGGPGPVSNATVTDSLPSGETYQGSTASQGSCSASGSTVTCSLGSLAQGSTATITITVKAAAAGRVTNTATLSSDQTATQTASVTANVGN